MKIDPLRKQALSLPEVPHFHYTSFRVADKIFITVPPEETHIHLFVGDEDTQPHFTTIASFVSKLPGEITSVFRNVLLVCDEQGLIGKELFAVDGCKLPSNASRSLSGTRADMAKKIEKIDKAIAHMLDTHRRQDAGQNVDTLTQREQQQIETLTKNSNKLREGLATNPEKTNRKGEPLKSNITDNDSATMKTHPQTKAMKARIDTREGRLLYSRRLGIVEPVFGNLHTKGLRRFTLRSRRKVDAQWKLFAIVHNVEKLKAKAP